jgi:hypothetical protein
MDIVGLKPGPWPAACDEAGPCAVARWPAARPSNQLGPAGSVAQRAERAPAWSARGGTVVGG